MKYFFLAVLLAAYFMSNLMRVSGVVVLPPLAVSMGLSAAAVAFLSSLFFYTYGASYGVWGVLVDNRGPFVCCGASLLLAAAGCFTMGASASALAIGAGRALCGMGMASAFTALLMYCAYAFSRENYPALVGMCLVIGHSGTVAAVAPLGWCLDLVGPRGVFFALAFAALLLGAILVAFKERDPRLAFSEGTRRLAVKEVASELAATARMSWRLFPLRVVMLTWASTAAAIAALQGLWAVAWLQTAAGMPLGTAYLCATWISFGMVAGPAFGGWLVRCCRNEKRSFFIVCLLTQASWLLWLLLSLFSGSAALFGAAGFLIGFFNGCGYVFMGSAVRSLVPLSQNGGTIGVINMFLYLMVIIFQWGTGVCLDLFKAPAGGYTNLGFLSGFFLIVLLQGWAFWLITKVNSFKSA